MDKYLYKPNNCTSDKKIYMAYPERKSFALSSLGYMWLSMIADIEDGISSGRLFTDSPEIKMKNNECSAISFSMSFDFDFMGVFNILNKYKIPFFTKNRDESYPLIFGGGQFLTTNPEPLKDVFDFVMLGDGEESFKKVLQILKTDLDKNNKLKKIAELEGIYVPSLNVCNKKVTESLQKVIYTPILSDDSYFKNTFIIEISRGCMNRCAFCTASYLNLPYRYYEYDKIIETVNLGLKHTNRIALLGAQLTSHPDFEKIIDYIDKKVDEYNIELSVSSIRVDAITPKLVQTLVKCGQKYSTIAIEAASERLRKYINKNISKEQILNAVKIAKENGLKGLKLYSMIGIPTETDNDIDEFIRLAKEIKTEFKSFDITFSFSSFIPKPQTPFQCEKREDTRILEKRVKYLEKEFAKIGVKSKFSSIKWDYWQSIISRGDCNLNTFLNEVYKEGGKLSSYKKAWKNLYGITNNDYNSFNVDEHLCWDFLYDEKTKNFLKNENNRLKKYI